MGVFQRKGSPHWHVWIDGATRPRVNTKIPIGETAEDRKASRRLAEQVYHQLMADRARHRFGLRRELPARTFADHRVWYAEHVSVLKRGTTREVSMLKQLGLFFDADALHRIDQARVREWRAWRKRTVSQSTIRREEALLKHLLTTAVPTYLESNPITGLRRVRVADTDTRVLTFEEEQRLLAVLTDPQDRAVVLCALDTLLRLSNVRQLTRKQDHGAYLFSDTKAGSVKIPISTRLRTALDALAGDGTYYFPRHATGGNAVTIAMFRVACEQAEVQTGRKTGGVSFHCLRHTGATRMLAAGVDVKTVMEIGGWRSLAVMSRYLHPTDERKREAVNRIAG
jgi:integrase